jgi:Putative lumazine-binding
MDNISSLIATPEDIEGITQTARDYAEGWFTADAERMRRCLHPDLVKRTIMRDPQQGTWELRRPSDAQMMVAFTQEGGGSDAPESEKTFEITILDVFRHIATVKVLSYPFMDYLHLTKLNDRWLIVNILWELRQGEMSPDS